MKVQFSRILTGTLIFVSLFSCNKKSTTPKAAAKKQVCAAVADGSVSAASPVSGAGLKLEGGDVSTDSSGIHVNPERLAAKAGTVNGDLPPFFIMYKVCEQSDTTCQSSNNWKETPHFSINNLVGKSKGTFVISTRACVDDLNLLSERDKSKYTTSCESNSPCYCGAELKTNYTNNSDPSSQDTALKNAADQINKALHQLNYYGRHYHRQAAAYVALCSEGNGTQDLQNAKNIANFSGAELGAMATLNPQDFVTGVADALNASDTKLALADTSSTASCPAGAIDTSSSGGDITLPTDSDTVISPSPDVTSQASAETNTGTASSSSSTAVVSDTSTGSSSTTSSTSSSSSTTALKGGTIALGVVAVIAGAALVATWGLSKYTKYRVTDVLDFIGDSKPAQLARGGRTIASRVAAAKAAFADMDKAIKGDNWADFEKARTRYEHAVLGGENLGAGRKTKALKDVITTKLGGGLPAKLQPGIIEMEDLHTELAKIKESTTKGKIDTGAVKLGTAGDLKTLLTEKDFKLVELEKRMKDAVQRGDPKAYAEAQKEYATEQGDPKKFPADVVEVAAGSEKFKTSFTVDEKLFEVDTAGKITTGGKTLVAGDEWLKPRTTSFPEPGHLEPVVREGGNPKTSKKGAIVGAIVAAAGIAAIAAGAYLVQPTTITPPKLQCGKFTSDTSPFWEGLIGTALTNLNAAQSNYDKLSAK